MPTTAQENLAAQHAALKAHAKAIAYLNTLCQSPLETDQRMYRLYNAAECTTPKELARFLQVRTTAIAKARKSGNIPSDWLLTILCVKNVFPQWILTGKGHIFAEYSEDTRAIHLDSTQKHQEDRKALERLSSYLLAEELLRRIALKQQEKT